MTRVVILLGLLPVFASAQPVEIGDGLQVMWEDRVVDAAKTTAPRVLHHPVNRGTVMIWDKPWEGGGTESVTVVNDVGADGKPLYRMYYIGWDMYGDVFGRNGKGGQKAENPMGSMLQSCYAESRDGLVWTRPNLGLVEFNGSKENNILMDDRTPNWGSGIVFFKDENPACPPGARYKALASAHATDYDIYLFTSPDGIHFTCASHPVIRLSRGDDRVIMGDTHLAAFYHPATKKYHVYLRGHRMLREEDRDKMFVDVKFREILHAEFESFDCEQRPRLVDFAAADGGPVEAYPLYTPSVFPYYRAPEILVGLPKRYNERGEWTKTFDALPDLDMRKLRFGKSARYGLAITDGLFMTSRDGQEFLRYDEAFLRPGPERHLGWLYGSCAFGYGIIETPAADGSGPEMSFYVPHGHWADAAKNLERWTLRRDGFASRQASFRGAKVVTRELVFAGDALLLNFATSARGRIRVKVFERGRGEPSAVSEWIFGDAVDRRVPFKTGSLGDLSGRPVTLEFEMVDADLYAFRFKKGMK